MKNEVELARAYRAFAIYRERTNAHEDAAKLIAVGTATAERQSFGGERLPSRHPRSARRRCR